MMLATGVGAEIQHLLATVVVGGLVTSTALTLLILPSVYPLFARLLGKKLRSPPQAVWARSAVHRPCPGRRCSLKDRFMDKRGQRFVDRGRGGRCGGVLIGDQQALRRLMLTAGDRTGGGPGRTPRARGVQGRDVDGEA